MFFLDQNDGLWNMIFYIQRRDIEKLIIIYAVVKVSAQKLFSLHPLHLLKRNFV